MSYGPVKVFTVTMASAGTLSSEADLKQSWQTVYLEIPSMTSNSQIHLQAARTSGGTYRRVVLPLLTTASIQTLTFSVQSTSTSRMVLIPPGLQYLKVETTATCDSGETFRFICCF